MRLPLSQFHERAVHGFFATNRKSIAPKLNMKLRKAIQHMRRRDFCKVLGAAATVAATTKGWPKPLGAGADETQSSDYAQFCALPESERVFSIVSGDRIVAEKLDPATWRSEEHTSELQS